MTLRQEEEVMIINLNDDWRFRSDDLQWIVDHRKLYRKKSTGEEYHVWKIEGYFSTLAGAILDTVQVRIRSLDGEYGSEALEPLLETLMAIREDVSRVLATQGQTDRQ